MNHGNERNNVGGNVVETGNNQAGSIENEDTRDFAEATGTITDAVAGAMIGAPFGLIGTVIGGVSGGIIGNQMVETAEEEDKTDSTR
ncbi:hypothetical protein V7124_23070 [Neobacillus niacini]|uniref:hypothetical protein n=1 Tax=Neobacillus niacini TaxID=86668 RepID=UPI002FFF2B09